MSFGDAIRTCFTKYATFTGRARRSEFWYFVLFGALLGIVTNIVDRGIGSMVTGSLVALALLVPRLAVGTRRLHDTGRSGWWQLLGLTIIGIIPLIVWWAADTNQAGDKYGPSPKGVAGYPVYPPA